MRKSPKQKKKNYSGYVKKSILIKSSEDKVWRKISNIGDLSWLVDEKNTVYLSKEKRGLGAIRNITFNDGNQIEEHIVAWKNKKYFSYVAVTGLPLRLYHATISIDPQTSKATKITWKSYINSKKMSKKEFTGFVSFMEEFYHNSLKNLKLKIEK